MDDRMLDERWPELTGDDWAHLPILRPGTALQAGGVYFDLNNPDAGPFTATGNEEATGQNRYIAQGDVDPNLWARFVGAEGGVGSNLDAPGHHGHATANQPA